MFYNNDDNITSQQYVKVNAEYRALGLTMVFISVRRRTNLDCDDDSIQYMLFSVHPQLR